MTYQGDFTLPSELLDQYAASGIEEYSRKFVSNVGLSFKTSQGW